MVKATALVLHLIQVNGFLLGAMSTGLTSLLFRKKQYFQLNAKKMKAMLNNIKTICDKTGLTIRAGYSGASKTHFASFHTNDKEARVVCSGHGSTVKETLKMLVTVFNDHHASEFNLTK